MRVIAAGLAAVIFTASISLAARGAEPELRSLICPVMVEHFYAVASGDAYVATLSAREAGEYDGSVTLFGKTEAYEVTFDHLHVSGAAPLSIRLPQAEQVDYVAMDTAGKTGIEPASCATFVISRGKDIDSGASMPTGVERVAVSRGKLPPLPCGKVYSQAEEIQAPLPAAYAGPKKMQADLDVLVDSNGRVIEAQIVKSSGDSTADIVMSSAARTMKFRPAQFLCTPVISQFYYSITYDFER